MDGFPLGDVLRRIRRLADCSQRELADRVGTSKTTIAGAESGTRDLPVSVLTRAAGIAGGRLVVLDASGAELVPMDPAAVRDAGGRLLPAHLDTRHGDEDWWGGEHRPRTRQPRYTFDLDRRLRDRRRAAAVPDDHHVPAPGDSLAERRAAREEERRVRYRARRQEEWAARCREGFEFPPDWGTGCSCPPGCDYVEGVNEDMTHEAGCACRCDVC